MAVIRIDRLGLAVRDIGAMTRFYQRAFDCELPAETAPMRGIRLRLGEQTIELTGSEPPGAPWPADPHSNDLTFQHFAIAVIDMARAHAHLLTIPGWTSISPDGPVRLPESSGGVTAFKFRDPEGHPLELLEFPGKTSGPKLFYEINHTAIVVKDTKRSVEFYQGALGLSPGPQTFNHGPEQSKLDNLSSPKVRVTPLKPKGQATPHVELLCYDEPPSGRPAPTDKTPRDAIATKIVFAADEAVALLRDPDGHDLILIPN